MSESTTRSPVSSFTLAVPSLHPRIMSTEVPSPAFVSPSGPSTPAADLPMFPLSPSATVCDMSSSAPTRVQSPAPVDDRKDYFQDSDRPDQLTKLEAHEDAASTIRDPGISTAHKAMLLCIFCVAQFLDAFGNSALFPALPVIGDEMGMNTTEMQWVFSAYQLTFSSFLLLSGRIADIYSPKWTFISGVVVLAFISLAAGFVPTKIPLIVLRALQGVGAALTIPSALSLLVWTFPVDPLQSRAIAIFGGTGCIGNVLGLLIGAVFAGEVSYRWCFWFIPCAAIPAALATALLVPIHAREAPSSDEEPTVSGKGSLDYIGISFLTTAMILFVFAITSGSTVGWGTAQVWVPLVGSGGLLAAFLYWEVRLPECDAAMPPSMWFYPNFGVLFGLALLPFGWWTASFLLFSELWQDSYGLSTLETALHFLPLGFSAGTIITVLATLPPSRHPKRIIMIGFALMLISSLMLPFARGMRLYWPVLFPAMILGSAGASLVFVNTNIAIFRTTPDSRSGLTGAALNSALQLGCVITVAAVTGITTSVNQRYPGDPYNGVSASFWFVFACTVVEAIVVGILYKEERGLQEEEKEKPHSSSKAKSKAS